MSVLDQRRPPFAWVSLDATRRVRRDLPSSRQAGALNALLALAEAASNRYDGRHEQGDTLKQIATNGSISERRMRDHLRELASIGLVRIEEAHDPSGRRLPTLYVLLDGPDESSGRPDAAADGSSGRPDAVSANPSSKSSGPTRARVRAEEEEAEPIPNPSQREGNSPPAFDGRTARRRQRSEDAFATWAAEHFPDAPASKVQALAAKLRERGIDPTVAAMQEYAEAHPTWTLADPRLVAA